METVQFEFLVLAVYKLGERKCMIDQGKGHGEGGTSKLYGFSKRLKPSNIVGSRMES